VNPVDAALERIYQRIGWRLIVAYQAFTYACSFTLACCGLIVIARIRRFGSGDAVELLAIFLGALLLSAAVATWGVLRSARPLIDWLGRPADAAGAEAAWRVALQLPEITRRWNMMLAIVLVSPIGIAATSEIAALSFAGVIVQTTVFILATGLLTLAGSFTAQLAVRPIVRAVAAALREPAERPSTGVLSLRGKLLIGPPVVALTAGLEGVALSIRPGGSVGGALPTLLVCFGLVGLVAGPPMLLLAYSTVQPLDDLLRATKRLKRGDFATRVAELSADEHGDLARSFNDAMASLETYVADNQRLLDELHASRARIVAASDAERRRVERNIHDGAQQQLVALAVKLRMLEEQVEDEQLRGLIATIGTRLKAALDDLRELARGLHPSVLSTDGLAPALEQLAARAPLPVTVTAPEDRFPEATEVTAYFVASEALANVGKYAQASRAEVSVERRNGRLTIRIADDGIGGANADTGSGLAGLADRVAALDGRLTVDSPTGHGTNVTAELPLT
jgi:signal transduction histidine kinase